MNKNGAALEVAPKVNQRLVLVLADMVEAALERDSHKDADGVGCPTKAGRRNGVKA